MHVFFKLARPLDQFPELNLPKLYLSPAGPPDGTLNEASPTVAGRWFRCVSCAKDFCEACEQSDVHDDTHVSLVFKSTVDLLVFTHFVGVEMPVCWRGPRSNS
ncbi:hypothetical protein A0H81_06379 [Grifola frondosa]|uniref:Uncharacterized protein n=1 Tax=Grifola frondosa TaxID=5627 RepID=A0A1C7MAE1_GRIFR|nr:hypothetical protein A0H81_06379 [Grifola frondosa]